MSLVAWDRLSARLVKRDVHRTIGRFGRIRRAYSVLQSRRQRHHETHHKSRLAPNSTSLFPHVSVSQSTQDLREHSIFVGLNLSQPIVEEIYQFACTSPLYEPGFEGDFYASEVIDGFLCSGRPTMRGLVKNPSHCLAIETIAKDPVLLEIVHSYLKYWPTQVTRHLTWTFASKLPIDEQRDRFLPLNYHYDVAGYNFMSVYFYITDMDEFSGAHVMITGSHDDKPFHTLFAPWSGKQTDAEILDHYGKGRELLIEGKAGFGFAQDPSCFHKLLPPIRQNRLIFQIRYA
ncbi:MAG: hypothetical protein ACFBSG_20155 [Leptolyngbyaceae cyanobacterium]